MGVRRALHIVEGYSHGRSKGLADSRGLFAWGFEGPCRWSRAIRMPLRRALQIVEGYSHGGSKGRADSRGLLAWAFEGACRWSRAFLSFHPAFPLALSPASALLCAAPRAFRVDTR
jgi:hypothetical protein